MVELLIETIVLEIAAGGCSPPEDLVSGIMEDAKKAIPRFVEEYHECRQLSLATLLMQHSGEDDFEVHNDSWNFYSLTISPNTSPWAHYLAVNLLDVVRILFVLRS